MLLAIEVTTLLLHGFTGHADSWDDVIAGASIDARAVTLHGHDFEKPLPELTTFEREVDRIAELVRAETPIRVCGYSMGGRIALGLLVRHPALVSSAILISTDAGLENEVEREERAELDREWCDVAEAGRFADAWAAQALFDSQKSLSAEILRRQHERRLRHSGRALSIAMQSLGLATMPNYWPKLRDIQVPVRVVAGELDYKFCQIAERMARELPHAALTIVPDCGHNVVLERPDVVSALLSSG